MTLPDRGARSRQAAQGPLTAVFCVLALLCGGAQASAQRAADADRSSGELRLSRHDDRLSLDAEAVPLRRLLEALSERFGFAVELRGKTDAPLSGSIIDLPVQLAIAQLLGRARVSYLLELAPPRAGEEGHRLSRLTVIGRDRDGDRQDGDTQDGDLQDGASAIPETPSREPSDPAESSASAEQEAIEILERSLLEAQDPELRQAAAEALKEIRTMGSDM